MREPAPTTRTMEIADLNGGLSGLVDEVSRAETRVLVKRGGIPVAALVSTEDLEQLARLDQVRAERWRVLEAMREPFRGVPTEEIEREAAKAVAEVRVEMRAEREAAAAKR